MSGIKAVRAFAVAAALAGAVAITACDYGGFHLSASDLLVGPNPAVPGDQVVATFFLNLAPIQRHTVIFTIDDKEHSRVTSEETPPVPYVIALGDAAELIAKYGTGVHSARVQVVAEEENESARTQSFSFELRQSTP